MATASRKAPWDKSNPQKRKGTSRKLTSVQKSRARRSAAKAGRPYPNLVDNMGAAAKGTRQAKKQSQPRAKTKKSAHKKTPVRSKPAVKDPHGGLTAADRAAFRRRDGAHLRPGVRKSERDMSWLDKKRKGSWAVRFYGRAGKLPPLKDSNGLPTRYALSAAAWGEPIPATAAAARKIAAKGRRLLMQYHRETSKRPRRA